MRRVSYIVILIVLLNNLLMPQKVNNYLKDNKYEEGIDHYEKVLKKNEISDDIKKDACSNLMILYGRYSELLSEFADVNANFHSTYYELKKQKNIKNYDTYARLNDAVCSYEKGNYKSAVKQLSECVELKYDKTYFNQIAKIWLGAAYYMTGDKKSAENIWNIISTNNSITGSELAYIYSRLKINRQKIPELLKSIGKDFTDQRVIRNVLQTSVFQEDYNSIITLTSKIDINYPLFITSKGRPDEEIYFDPSVYYTVSAAYGYLSYYYANLLNTVCSNDEQEKYGTKTYRAKYFFNAGNFSDCISCIQYNAPTELLLASAFYKKNEKDKAEAIFKKIENGNDFLLKSMLGTAYLKLNIYQDKAYQLLKDSYTEAVKTNSKQIQLICMNLAGYYFHNQQYEAAADYLAKHYKYSRTRSLSSNPPEYRMRLIASYIFGRNYARFEEINSSISSIEESFSSVAQIREIIRRIDIITLIGLESRAINKS